MPQTTSLGREPDMPQITIPLTTYSIKTNRAGYPLGSPGICTTRDGSATHRILMRIPINQIPDGAVVTSAEVQVWIQKSMSGSIPLRIREITQGWKSSVTWSGRPSVGPIMSTTTIEDPPANTMFSFPVTTWANERKRPGLAIDTTLTSVIKVRGSSSAINQPVMVVTYYTPNSQPVNLSPQGGAVSVPTPILSYTGDVEDMDHQQVQYSSDGTLGGITFDSGSIPATTGRYVPSGGEPVLAAGESTYWRVQTSGGGGVSPWSPWVQYSYEPIVPPVITQPLATTDDGSPPVVWTVDDMVSWKAELYNGTKIVSQSTWDLDPENRDWYPAKGVPVPGGVGRVVLYTTDSISPRVAAENAPVWARVEKTFTTVLGGEGPSITNLAVTYEEPIPVITGTRSLGVPDEIGLVRDGVMVTLWDEDGVPRKWVPGGEFFDGNDFTIRDYTASSREEHTWSVLTRTDGVASDLGDSVTATFVTGSVWMVDPRTGVQVEVFGNNSAPAVSQVTEEASILHTPVQGDLVVEPVRRRLVRTTRSGGIEGLVLNNDENVLQEWVLSDSALKYRLIFGKVNWSMIFGDYTPTDVFYTHPDPECDDTLVLMSLNWWERLAD